MPASPLQVQSPTNVLVKAAEDGSLARMLSPVVGELNTVLGNHTWPGPTFAVSVSWGL